MTELEHLQAVVDTEADYSAADDAAHNARDVADTKYASWSKAIKDLGDYLNEHGNDWSNMYDVLCVYLISVGVNIYISPLLKA